MGFGAGGAATFIELKDTPETYVGQSGKLAKVKATEDGIALDLLLSFTDWYAGAVPTSYPWTPIGNIPFSLSGNLVFSPILKNAKEEYYVYVSCVLSALLWMYNLTTGHWVELASPDEIVSLLGKSLALSPDGKKLVVSSGVDRDKLQIYDIETDAWTATAIAPDLDGVTPYVAGCVWADSDTVWAFACKTSVPTNGKMYKYTVSTTTWDTFANSTGTKDVLNGNRCVAIKTDGSVIYVGEVGASADNYLKYTISTDTYDVSGNISGAKYYLMADNNRNRLWYYLTSPTNFRYMDVDDESLHTDFFELNPQRDTPSNISIGVYETTVCIALHRTTEPYVWTYVAGGMWKLGEQVLTDYNLAVFKKPADGYAILATNVVSGYAVPVYLFSTLCLPAGTWEFFYPKDGDYTQLVISGSELK
ncbi:hypothetical protein ES708_17705 [subsurface metagenome]